MKTNQINWPAWIVPQTRHGLAMLFGMPGTGKTAICNAAVSVLGMDEGQTILLGQMQPDDIIGNPIKSHVTFGGVKRECVKYIKNEMMLKFKHGKCLTLVDECNHAPPPVQAAAQEEIFNYQPEQGLVIAVANPTAVATDGYEFSAPVVNRMCLLKWESDLSAFQEGCETGKFPEPNIPVLPDDWKQFIPKWTHLLGSFSRSFGEYFDEDKCFPTKPEETSKPWCSYRSWWNAMVNLAAAESVGATEDTARKILAGFVGDGPAEVFLHFSKSEGLPTPASFYNSPESECHRLPRRFDTAVACIKGVVYHTKQQIDEAPSPYEAKRAWEKGLDFVEVAFKHNREVISAAVPSFLKLKPAAVTPEQRSAEVWESVSSTRQEAMSGA